MMTKTYNSYQLTVSDVETDRLNQQPVALDLHRTNQRVMQAIRLTLLLLFTSLFASQAFAAKAPIYTGFLSNKAVSGYDAVSYFQADGKPVKGKKKYSTQHKGATWYFSSQENLDLFTDNPERYEPQFGGYCAYAVAIGTTAKGDPLQYHISDNKLYLNLNTKFKNIWLNDKNNFIRKGHEMWPNVLK